MSEEEAVQALNEIKPGNAEINHVSADLVIIAFLRDSHPRVALAWQAAQVRDGGWGYA